MIVINKTIEDLLGKHGELYSQLIELEMQLRAVEDELFSLGTIC